MRAFSRGMCFSRYYSWSNRAPGELGYITLTLIISGLQTAMRSDWTHAYWIKRHLLAIARDARASAASVPVGSHTARGNSWRTLPRQSRREIRASPPDDPATAPPRAHLPAGSYQSVVWPNRLISTSHLAVNAGW